MEEYLDLGQYLRRKLSKCKTSKTIL